MHPEPSSVQKRRLTPRVDQALASMATPTARVTRKYPTSAIAVSTGPRGTVNDTTANASVIPPASTNHRRRPNKLIRLSFYGYKQGFPDRFRSTTRYFRHILAASLSLAEGSSHPAHSFPRTTPAKITLSVERSHFPQLGVLGRAQKRWCLMAFPVTRLRRLRRTAQLRDLVRETRLTPEALVYPMFVCPGEGVRKAVGSMPGVFNLSVDEAVKEAQEVHSLGVLSAILFGLPAKKDDVATGAWADDGIVQQAARAIKREVPELILMGDVCLCEYMSHGHCGIVKSSSTPMSLGAAARDALSARRGAAVKAVKSREETEKVIDELASIVASVV